MNVLLQGVVGSTAYGLAGPDSDQDRLGVFMAPTENVLGLRGAQAVQESRVSHDPDKTYHELGKYVSLALKSNPTVLELMYLPTYEVQTDLGRELVAMRDYFPSESYVRAAYGGYAKQQADRLMRRREEGKNGFAANTAGRVEKHARHCARLLLQGAQLLREGTITVNVGNYRDELFEVGRMAVSDPLGFYYEFQSRLAEMDSIKSVLPEHPDEEAVNTFLVLARKSDLG